LVHQTSSPADDPTRKLTPAETAEVERHKYFLSEQAGHDVGWEFAEQDWREKFGPASDRDAPSVQQPAPGIGSFFKRLFSKAAM